MRKKNHQFNAIRKMLIKIRPADGEITSISTSHEQKTSPHNLSSDKSSITNKNPFQHLLLIILPIYVLAGVASQTILNVPIGNRKHMRNLNLYLFCKK